jgi:hypothetical protein
VDATSTLPAADDIGAARPAPEDWAAVAVIIRERMRELSVSTAQLARDTGLSETTIRYIGRPDRGHRRNALVAISAALRWRYDHLTNILHGHPEKNITVRTGGWAGLERLLHAEMGLVKDDLSYLTETLAAISDKVGVLRRDRDRSPRARRPRAEAISDLPMVGDMDADYSPQYVKLARILRDKIKTGQLTRLAPLPAAHLVSEYHVSAPVAYAALEMLAANRLIDRPARTRSYRVTWDATHPHTQPN